MALAKRTDLATQLQISGSAENDRLDQALAIATAMIERYCKRSIEYVDGDVTETFDGCGVSLLLKAWPVTTLTSVTFAGDYDFAGADAYTENTEFVCDYARGELLRLPRGYTWPGGWHVIQVVYRGGYNGLAENPVFGVEFPPGNIQQACLLQAVEAYQRRNEPGVKVAWSGEGVSAGSVPAIGVLPSVKGLLAGELRL